MNFDEKIYQIKISIRDHVLKGNWEITKNISSVSNRNMNVHNLNNYE